MQRRLFSCPRPVQPPSSNIWERERFFVPLDENYRRMIILNFNWRNRSKAENPLPLPNTWWMSLLVPSCKVSRTNVVSNVRQGGAGETQSHEVWEIFRKVKQRYITSWGWAEITRLESKVFRFERLHPLSPVEVSKSQTNIGSEKNCGSGAILGLIWTIFIWALLLE